MPDLGNPVLFSLLSPESLAVVPGQSVVRFGFM